ncbi:MAG TPA: hypothetical protein VF212_15585 [Longimicrobiales bacterium]
MIRRSNSRGGARPRPGGPELSRKAIHVLASIAAGAVALEAPPVATPWLFLGTFLVAVAIEEARRRSATFGRLFERAFGGMLREREHRGTTGATTLAAGFAIAVLLLPPAYAAIGIVVGGIGDAAAALAGRALGRNRFASGKSLEGGLACFFASLPAAWVMPGMDLAPAVVTAATTTVLELLPVPFDDNLWLAPAAGIVAWAAMAPLP